MANPKEGINKINVRVCKSANYQTYDVSIEYQFEDCPDETYVTQMIKTLQARCRSHVMDQIAIDKQVK